MKKANSINLRKSNSFAEVYWGVAKSVKATDFDSVIAGSSPATPAWAVFNEHGLAQA